MAYCIIEALHREYPSVNAVSSALAPLGLTHDELLSAFKTYICPLSPSAGSGYGAALADDIKGYLEKTLQRDGIRAIRNRAALAYSRALNEHADFGLKHERLNKTVFFEIAFRHNYERDLLKFQIGAAEGTLAAAVLVLAVDPKTIEASYVMMPEFDSVIRVLDVLRPAYPLVVIGLRGSHAA